MNATFKQIRLDKIIKWGLLFSLILLVLHTLLLVIFYLALPPILPIYNQLPWGDSRLGNKIEIIIPLAISFGFFISNYLLITKLYATMPLVARIISITTLLTTVLGFIFIMRTIQILL